MLKKSLGASFINILARGGQLLFFLTIGNYFGITDVTDKVFFFYAPLLVIMSVAAGVAGGTAGQGTSCVMTY